MPTDSDDLNGVVALYNAELAPLVAGLIAEWDDGSDSEGVRSGYGDDAPASPR